MADQTIKFIEGKRIYLRSFEPGDLDIIYPTLFEAEGRRLTGTQQVFSREGVASFMAKTAGDDTRLDLVICDQQTNEAVGEVVLNDISHTNRSGNIRIGIFYDKDFNKGYGSEALILMLNHGFGFMNLHRIELGVYEFNPRAIHVYEKLGFKREGVVRDQLYHNFRYHNLIMMSILEDEFRALYHPETN